MPKYAGSMDSNSALNLIWHTTHSLTSTLFILLLSLSSLILIAELTICKYILTSTIHKVCSNIPMGSCLFFFFFWNVGAHFVPKSLILSKELHTEKSSWLVIIGCHMITWRENLRFIHDFPDWEFEWVDYLIYLLYSNLTLPRDIDKFNMIHYSTLV